MNIKEFTARYNMWKRDTSSLGKYAPPSKFTEKNATGLEKAIRAFFAMSGIKCWKVDVQGTYRATGKEALQVKSNGTIVKGGKAMRWTTSSASKGVSDLFTLIQGRFIAIEVKVGKDRQSAAQKEFENDVVYQGGYYMIVRSFADFQKQLKAFAKSVK